MNAGFISPSFRMLEVNWQHDFEMVKLGVPTLMGHLVRAGHTDLRHWDFDAQVCAALEEDPTSFDVTKYFDPALVQGFLRGADDTLRAQTERLLDVLGIIEREIFGISLSAVLDRIRNVMALAAVGQCLSKVLKERYPRCTIVFGGLQVNPDSLQEEYYRRFMEDCDEIDYCLRGRGDEVAVQLFRNVWQGRHDLNAGLERLLYRVRGPGPSRIDSTGTACMDRRRLDGDLAQLPKPHFDAHHPAHTKAGAAAQAESAVRQAAALSTRSMAAAGLARLGDGPAVAYADTHYPDGTEIPADVAGAHDYTAIPAHVPIFDPTLVDRFRFSGLQIMKRFHFDREILLRYSRFEGDRIVVLPHIFVRGCNAPCGFCSYAYKPIEGEDIIQTVEGLKFLSETYGCKHFHFLNTQINSVYQYCEAFCDAVLAARLDILWSDCCNMRALDERLLDKIRAAGGVRLVYGVESPDDEMLRFIHKGVTVAKIERLLRAAHERGIWNHVLLIAGMPHETRAKQDRMMDFLTRTAEQVDFYTVSSFYLIASSPWGMEPEKFGIERISSPDQLLEEQAFNEKAGGRWESDDLPWAVKKQQIVESTKRFYKTIAAAKGQSRCVGGNIDLYLLMFLYGALGHDGKAEIRRIYERTARYMAPSVPGEAPAGTEEEALPPEAFRIQYPLVVRRANEADQTSLLQVPVTFLVSLREDNRRHFCASRRFTLEYRTPRIAQGDERFSRAEIEDFRRELPESMHRLAQSLGPFLMAVETRFSPQSAAEMARHVARNLPRFRPFTEAGYTVMGPPEGRTLLERTLQWSGVDS